MTSGLEINWDYPGRMERDKKQKKINEASKKAKKGKVKKY